MLARIFIATLVVLSSFPRGGSGQVKFRVNKLNADSLVALISEKKDIERVDALNLLSHVICRKELDSSILLASQAITLSEKLEYHKGLADGYYNLGNPYFLLDSLQPTIAYYLKACRKYEDLDPCIEYGRCCLQIALMNYFTRGPEESPPYLDKAISVFNHLGDKEDKYNINFTLSVSNNVVHPRRLDSVIYFGIESMNYIDTTTDHNELAYIYSEIGEAYSPLYIRPVDTSDLTTALSWFFKGLKLRGITDDMKITLYLNIASTHIGYETEKHTMEAISYLEKAKSMPDTCVGVYDQKPAIYQMLGAIRFGQGDYRKAIQLYKEGIRIAEDRLSGLVINEYPEPIHGYNNRYYIRYDRQLLYEGIYDSYLKLGDPYKALEYYRLSRKAADEIHLEQNRNLITMLEAVSMDEKNKSQIELLASENELHKVRVVQSRTYVIAMGGFVILLVLITILMVRQRRARLVLREQKLLHDLELKEVESEKLKELDAIKSRFFANISHEFRTPLTLIMRPLEKVLSKIEDPQHKRDLDVAKKYTIKLQNLINNLLTISKLESGKMHLRASEVDVVKLVNNYVQAFESLAKQKNVRLTFENGNENINAFLDREKFEQILNNLLSNAFKFTDSGGRIAVAVCSRQYAVGSLQYAKGTKKRTPEMANCQLPNANTSGRCVEIKVSDTGLGISPVHLPHIFDRFYQVDKENNNLFEGTGIGLALTRELVELHHGTIEVESEPGKSTSFIILLPLGNDHLKPEEIVQKQEEMITVENLGTDSYIQNPTSNTEHRTPNIQHPTSSIEQPILLIVEDNADMRVYIREFFEQDYRIIEAVDGQDGYEKSVEQIPDIIISDVMMPGMDGNAFCKKVKTDERTSHIPVILLTARAASEHKIEGLETGADDFISKPFNGEELVVRVKNLVEQRKRMRKLLEDTFRKSRGAFPIDLAESGITSMDEQFLQNIMEVLREHHSNPAFNIHDFGGLVGLSVAQLNRKIRALTGQSTADFIRTYRLTRAAGLIQKKSGTIAEIAYDVGFNSPSYFSECFKNHFGRLPSEFNGNS